VLQGGLVIWPKWKTGNGRQYFTDIFVDLQPLWYNRSENLSNSVKKRQIRAVTPFKVRALYKCCYYYILFKVIEVGINRKPVCDFLLVINTNWHSYRFGVIAAYCSNFGHLCLGTAFFFVWYKNVDIFFFRFVTQCTRLTNGQTDRQTAFSWLYRPAFNAAR